MRLYFVFLILLVSSCSPNDSKPNTPVETEGIPTVRVAEHFSIEESAKNWTANILDPETGTIEHSFSFTKGEKYKLISLTSTVNGMVSILDATDCLAGIGKFDYVHDSKIKELQYSSRMSAKVDNTAIQDGHKLYHHVFLFTEKGKRGRTKRSSTFTFYC